MRASTLIISTLRDDPSDAEIASHRLLMRSGMLVKCGAGVYVYGHFLHRVLERIKRIVSEELAVAGGVEITMPILQERSLWERSGRWATYQASKTMLTATDRNGQQFGLSPTAEEVVTDFADAQVSSYKQLPACWFQQNTKFRDEIRPRFGLMRVKEFIMMDAYSFHASAECLKTTYRAMHDAYLRIFRRCGLEAMAVEADSGAIGGDASHEFMVAADIGEDAIAVCPPCGYAANLERAVALLDPSPAWTAPAAALAVATPGVTSIVDVVAFLQKQGYSDLTAANAIKAVLMVAQTATGEKTVAAFIRGDREVNEVKLHNAVTRRCGEAVLGLRPMHPDEIRAATGARPGFCGPLESLQVHIRIADQSLSGGGAWVVGAGKDDEHLVGFRYTPATEQVADLLLVRAGDRCQTMPAERLAIRRGIEVGHIFQLGDKYSKAMDATFQDAEGKLRHFVMGCYGIGVSRLAAAAVEQHHDKDGIRWPLAITPYHAVVLPMRADDPVQRPLADTIYDELRKADIECILDDRDAKPGVKFKDWDLIGIPCKIIVGRGAVDGKVELKRRSGEVEELPVAAVVTRMRELVGP